jgi:hypothetical protein
MDRFQGGNGRLTASHEGLRSGFWCSMAA